MGPCGSSTPFSGLPDSSPPTYEDGERRQARERARPFGHPRPVVQREPHPPPPRQLYLEEAHLALSRRHAPGGRPRPPKRRPGHRRGDPAALRARHQDNETVPPTP